MLPFNAAAKRCLILGAADKVLNKSQKYTERSKMELF